MTKAQTAEKFLNIHEVMTESVLESRNESVEWTTQTFRMPKPLKEAMEEICAGNGTNPSVFLRKCAEVLVRDYTQPQPSDDAQ